MIADLINWGSIYVPNRGLRTARDILFKTVPDMNALEAYHAKCKTEHEAKMAAAREERMKAATNSN